jgi:hypothetical protein
MRILRIADVSDSRAAGMSRVTLCPGDEMRAMGHQVDYLLNKDLLVGGWAKLRNRLIMPLAIPRIIRRRIKEKQKYDVVFIHEPSSDVY